MASIAPADRSGAISWSAKTIGESKEKQTIRTEIGTVYFRPLLMLVFQPEWGRGSEVKRI